MSEGTQVGGRLTAGDQDLSLAGMVALDSQGRLGLITDRRVVRECGGCLVWFGVLCAPYGDRRGKGCWRWTAARPLVVATSLKEYADHSDDLLGIAN